MFGERSGVLPGLPDVAELQLLFAQYNFMYFDGEIPAHRIAYNARFSNVAATSWRPIALAICASDQSS